jgi:hypothetical protein
MKGKTSAFNEPSPINSQKKGLNKRQFQKDRDGNTNHWAAMSSHINEYDQKVKNLERVNHCLDKHYMKASLDVQMKNNKERRLDVIEHEKELELKMINQSLDKYKKEESDRRLHKSNLKKFLASEYDKALQDKISRSNYLETVEANFSNDKLVNIDLKRDFMDLNPRFSKKVRLERMNGQFAKKFDQSQPQGDPQYSIYRSGNGDISKPKKPSSPAKNHTIICNGSLIFSNECGIEAPVINQ